MTIFSGNMFLHVLLHGESENAEKNLSSIILQKAEKLLRP